MPTLPDGDGLDLSAAIKVWTQVTTSECRQKLLSDLISLKIGLKDIEDYMEDLQLKFRSSDFKAKSEKGNFGEIKIVGEIMGLKLRDEKRYYEEILATRNDYRRKIKRLYGENSKKTRSVIKNLRQESTRTKRDYTRKFQEKIEHLKKRHTRRDEENLSRVPDDMKDYSDLSVFSKEKFDNISTEPANYKVIVIGDIKLDEHEETLLRLHPKFAILNNIEEEDCEWDLELGFAKLRYEIGRESEEKIEDEEEITEEERTRLEEIEARARMAYEPEDKILDMRKQVVTDAEDNTRVHLPRPLNPNQEATIELRRSKNKHQIADFIKNNCTQKGEQSSNLTESEKKV